MNFFDDNFGMFPVWDGRNPLYGKHAKNLMKTDVRETEDTYEVDIDLPGFKKDEIKRGPEGRLSDHQRRQGPG